MQENPFYQEWSNRTVLDPLGLAAVIVLGAAMVVLPRRYTAWPMIIMACFIPPAQRIVFVGLDFDLLRLMILFGWLRLVMRDELRGLRWSFLDTALVMWTVVGVVTSIIVFGTASALIYKLGVSFDSLGLYFLFRCLFRDFDDLRQVVLAFVIVSVPVAAAFLLENMTGRNLFSNLGGVPEITVVRQGRLRCQGAFAQPILAGCFWASIMPLMAAGYSRSMGGRIIAVVGLISSVVIVVTCASATPLMAVIVGLVGVGAFAVRHWMGWARWGVLLSLVVLHILMKAPVWHLISRIQVVGGSSSWHRYHLIDQAISHIGEWWLFGSAKGTQHWGYLTFDVTNFYVVMGLHGGVLLLILFILLIALGFQAVGRICRACSMRHDVFMGWALGVSLFIHSMNFLAIAYFGQITMIWYLNLALIGSLAAGRQSTIVAQRFRQSSNVSVLIPSNG